MRACIRRAHACLHVCLVSVNTPTEKSNESKALETSSVSSTEFYTQCLRACVCVFTLRCRRAKPRAITAGLAHRATSTWGSFTRRVRVAICCVQHCVYIHIYFFCLECACAVVFNRLMKDERLMGVKKVMATSCFFLSGLLCVLHGFVFLFCCWCVVSSFDQSIAHHPTNTHAEQYQ